MRYFELVEAPIRDLEVHGMDKPGTFSDVDRRLLSNPAHIQKIRNQFESQTYDFDLYFINQTGHSYLDKWGGFNGAFNDDNSDHTGQSDPAFLDTRFGLKLHPKSDTITVVYLSNANEINSISLTPWIVAHRFAHALTENAKTLSPPLRRAMESLPSFAAGNLAPDVPQLGTQLTLAALMTNRSARMGMHSEFREELIAQYLITGTIKLALRPDTPLAHGVDRAYVEKRIGFIGRKIRQNIENILNECVGKIFVSV